MIVVIASFRIAADATPRARSLIPAVVETTRAENGCIAYDVAEDIMAPGLFRVSERWVNRDALNAHLVAPHMAEWGKARAEMGMSERAVSIFTIAAQEDL
jgi:quinol monooxygenase YgiN